MAVVACALDALDAGIDMTFHHNSESEKRQSSSFAAAAWRSIPRGIPPIQVTHQAENKNAKFLSKCRQVTWWFHRVVPKTTQPVAFMKIFNPNGLTSPWPGVRI